MIDTTFSSRRLEEGDARLAGLAERLGFTGRRAGRTSGGGRRRHERSRWPTSPPTADDASGSRWPDRVGASPDHAAPRRRVPCPSSSVPCASSAVAFPLGLPSFVHEDATTRGTVHRSAGLVTMAPTVHSVASRRRKRPARRDVEVGRVVRVRRRVRRRPGRAPGRFRDSAPPPLRGSPRPNRDRRAAASRTDRAGGPCTGG